MFQGTQEGTFFLLDDVLYQLMLFLQFWKGLAHLFAQHFHQTINKRLVGIQKSESITNGTAQNPSDDVTSTRIARQLSVGNGKGHRAHVIGNYTNGNIGLLVFAILFPCDDLHFSNEWCKYIGIVIGLLALEHHA